MKKKVLFVKRILSILLLILLLAGCTKTSKQAGGLWSLGDRYPLTYSSLVHVYHYGVDNTEFYLSEMRSKKQAGASRDAVKTIEIDGLTYSLSKPSEKSKSDTTYTYYECLTGTRRLTLGNVETQLDIETLVSLQDAAALMQNPLNPPAGIQFYSEEWDALFRTEGSNLQFYIYVNDNGKHFTAPSDDYETRTENGETYLFNERDLAILYTNGNDTIWICQAYRADQEHILYCTLDECKAILAMLGN